jgi:DNA-directed RNA polymerase sigma subunit (sigma70/sigma32)
MSKQINSRRDDPEPPSSPAPGSGNQGEARLTAAEEIALTRASRLGDRPALARLMAANQGLVVTKARTFMGRVLPLEDLISEGNLGLLRAARDFDPAFGSRFGTYAGH